MPTPSLPLMPTTTPPTVDPCASIITQKDALLALKDGFENGDTVLIDWGSDTDPCDENTSNWSYITCVSDKVTVISLCRCNMY